jgi:hypothetical protein
MGKNKEATAQTGGINIRGSKETRKMNEEEEERKKWCEKQTPWHLA